MGQKSAKKTRLIAIILNWLFPLNTLLYKLEVKQGCGVGGGEPIRRRRQHTKCCLHYIFLCLAIRTPRWKYISFKNTKSIIHIELLSVATSEAVWLDMAQAMHRSRRKMI
jgi:hypothetical protein